MRRGGGGDGNGNGDERGNMISGVNFLDIPHAP